VTTKPLKILLAADNPERMRDLSDALQKHQAITVNSVATPQQALSAIKSTAVDVLVVDETLLETSGLQFIKEVVGTYPLINCALVSPLAPEEFHETTEGLGLFMQLPPRPGAETAAQMIGILDKIYGLLAIADTDRRKS
jgi:CheY-like chemotaxis protein